jgi:hypothetical protein
MPQLTRAEILKNLDRREGETTDEWSKRKAYEAWLAKKQEAQKPQPAPTQLSDEELAARRKALFIAQDAALKAKAKQTQEAAEKAKAERTKATFENPFAHIELPLNSKRHQKRWKQLATAREETIEERDAAIAAQEAREADPAFRLAVDQSAAWVDIIGDPELKQEALNATAILQETGDIEGNRITIADILSRRKAALAQQIVEAERERKSRKAEIGTLSNEIDALPDAPEPESEGAE